MSANSSDKWPAKQFRVIWTISLSVIRMHTMFATPVVIANNNIHWMLVDNGSSVDILYYQAFERMGLKVSDLKPLPNLIYGFTKDSIIPLGVISLPITVEEYLRQSCVMTNFLVIDQPSVFNSILGRPSLRELRAITSIHHLLIKFPTPYRVGVVKGDQQEARQCYH